MARVLFVLMAAWLMLGIVVAYLALRDPLGFQRSFVVEEPASVVIGTPARTLGIGEPVLCEGIPGAPTRQSTTV